MMNVIGPAQKGFLIVMNTSDLFFRAHTESVWNLYSVSPWILFECRVFMTSVTVVHLKVMQSDDSTKTDIV